MSFYGYRGNAALSAFGGGAPPLFVGGPEFVGGSDQGVFYGSDTGFIAGAKNQGLIWVPATASMKTNAGKKWAELMAPDVSAKDAAYMEGMRRKLSTLLDSFHAAVGTHSIIGYSADATQQIIYVGDQLKAALRELAAYRVTHEAPVEDYVPPEPTAARTSVSREAVTETRSELTAGMPGAGPLPEEEKPNVLLYVGIGVGVLALGALLLRRRRPAATAGYRRRRRRR